VGGKVTSPKREGLRRSRSLSRETFKEDVPYTDTKELSGVGGKATFPQKRTPWTHKETPCELLAHLI